MKYAEPSGSLWRLARPAALLAAFAVMGMPAMSDASSSPAPDAAVIVDSGSTNTSGYKIDVRSDGTGTLTLQNRLGVAQSEPKAFSMSSTVVKKFFADLKSARDGKAASEPCMKSASFGTSTHVSWHDWTSPDLDCPPADPLMKALDRDVSAIRSASGVDSMPLHRSLLPGGPPHVIVEPSESPRPTST